MSSSDGENKIVVGMSGGVDSAVCCKLLADRGYSVTGVYLVMSDAHLSAQRAALAAAEELGVPLLTIDLRRNFSDTVITPFITAYCRGLTPNPCVMCNPLVKFKALLDTADDLGVEKIATGHYARIGQSKDRPYLFKALDLSRDQSYMLYRLGDGVLERLVLPLGDYGKDEVRQIAKTAGLSSFNSPDSQDICFCPGEGYAEFIHRNGKTGNTGHFVSLSGEVLQEHSGVENYTVGQRRGLGVNAGKPMYVNRILDNGDILLAAAGEGYASGVFVKDFVAYGAFDIQSENGLSVKLRSAAEPVGVSIRPENGLLNLIFNNPMRPPAPGQSAVLYRGDILIGGGIIADFY